MHTFLTSIAAKIKNGPLIATSYEFIFSLKQQHNNLLLQISIGMPFSIQLKYEQGKTASWVSKIRKGSVSWRFD
jgi:hypothetical protein